MQAKAPAADKPVKRRPAKPAGCAYSIIHVTAAEKEKGQKPRAGAIDMLPLSRTLKNETYLGVLLCPGKVR
jgi:hypothetical protein